MMFAGALRLGLMFALASNLFGCTTVEQASLPSTSFIDHAQQGVTRFSGRIAVHFQQDGKNEHMNGSFQWQQRSDETRIELSAPTGQIMAEIIVTNDNASLTQAGKETRNAANIDQLTNALLGWPMPVAGMRDWLQGTGHNASGARFFASSANDSFTSSDGWQIRYASWHDKTHPKRIDLERHIDSEGGDVSLRIVLDPPNE